ncbi:MAG: hypothetical protein NVSMB38_07000 [Ktedonobacteraceae bacterium]
MFVFSNRLHAGDQGTQTVILSLRGISLHAKIDHSHTATRSPVPQPLFVPIIFTLAAKLDDIPLPTFVQNPTKIVNALVAIHRRLNTDGVTGYFDHSLVAEALGCELDWKTTPPTIMPPEKETLLANIELDPQALRQRGRIPVALEVIQRLNVTLRNGPALLVALPGPLRLALQLFGPDFVTRLASDESEAVDIFDMLTELLRHLAQAFCVAETHILLIDEETVPESLWEQWESAMTATWNAICFHGSLPVLFFEGATHVKPISGTPLLCLLPQLADSSAVLQQSFAVALPTTGELSKDVTRWTSAKICVLITTDGEIPYQSGIQDLHSIVTTIGATLKP